MRLNHFLIVLLAVTSFFPISAAYAEKAPIDYARELSQAFENVAVQITPSMVSISSVKRVKAAPRGQLRPPLPNDPFFEPFRDFFGDDLLDRFPQRGDPNGFAQQGLGTGVIVDDRGHILTNNHVIEGADEVTVRMHDNTSHKAEVVGTDPRTDLAVIRVKAKKLVPAKLGDSEQLQIGQWVIAAGNPFGLENSITAGIVSAKGRSLMGGMQYEDFIQTDAAINPGNSGGPLVNLYGEVVGINTAIFSRSGGYMGIGFAIPINMARNIMKSLIETGKVVRGWLGVGIQNLTPDLAASFGYSGNDGALISHVEEGGPASKADIKQGDIIIRIGEKRIKDINQLRNSVAAIAPGKTVEVEFVREGERRVTDVKIGELTASSLPADRFDETGAADDDLGITVEELTADLKRSLNTKRSEGVVVTSVNSNSIAARSGLTPGDIILRIGSKDISNLKDFQKAIKESDLEKGVRLVVESQGMQRYVFIKTRG